MLFVRTLTLCSFIVLLSQGSTQALLSGGKNQDKTANGERIMSIKIGELDDDDEDDQVENSTVSLVNDTTEALIHHQKINDSLHFNEDSSFPQIHDTTLSPVDMTSTTIQNFTSSIEFKKLEDEVYTWSVVIMIIFLIVFIFVILLYIIHKLILKYINPKKIGFEDTELQKVVAV
ncbi:hypothetical protein PVAND_002348 [Polypedilum vanderplanki]|uniref:Uncharacterized protein n=1 Tax=Polypedilum vanderplanki TaxID=319348 RepID=A0A9J6BRX0_POLVA|nr:hypothetical protein PVAND_002348 [Polypedilum vanderplanki]